ncbi:MAG: TetR/AcrR family transcriptional regulator [Porcipelethomonas sp.]
MKEDQRIRLSKQLLRNALIELLKEKGINKISVREICSTAEINRTTFYKYYGSQYDLLEDIENTLLEELSERIGNGANAENKRLPQILKTINENAEVYRLLANNSIDPEFPQRLLNLPAVRESLREITNKQEFTDYSNYTYEFLTWGGYSVIRRWLNKEDRESPEEMAEYINRLYMTLGE